MVDSYDRDLLPWGLMGIDRTSSHDLIAYAYLARFHFQRHLHVFLLRFFTTYSCASKMSRNDSWGIADASRHPMPGLRLSRPR